MSSFLPTGGRILVVKLSSLGDLFHALPTVHLLKTRLDLTIDWVTQPEYLDLVECFTDVSERYTFPRHQPLRQWSKYRAQFTERYDAVLDLQGLMKSAMAAKGAARGAPIYGHVEHREAAGLLYKKQVGDVRPNRHAIERWLDFVREAGIEFGQDDLHFPVRFPVPDIECKGLPIGLVPRSRWAAKNYQPEQFILACRQILEKKPNAHFYVFGGPDDVEAADIIVRGLDGHAESLAGKYSLLESGGALSKMKTVISVDSGPLHMAVAAGVPVVGLFGVTDPARTGPYGDRHTVLLSESFKHHDQLSREFKKAEEGAWTLDPRRVARATLNALNTPVS